MLEYLSRSSNESIILERKEKKGEKNEREISRFRGLRVPWRSRIIVGASIALLRQEGRPGEEASKGA